MLSPLTNLHSSPVPNIEFSDKSRNDNRNVLFGHYKENALNERVRWMSTTRKRCWQLSRWAVSIKQPTVGFYAAGGQRKHQGT